MKKEFTKFFKRIYTRLLVRIKTKIENQTKKLEENEIVCSSICRKLINSPSSKFLIAPISGKRYIKNEKLSLFVIMDGGRVSVTNHVYHYDIILNIKEWDRLVRMYDMRTERDRQAYEEEIHSQIGHSLQSILEKINKVEQ